ncbi:MAG: hypothetical protein WCC57_14170, partial [Paracoccaceae bacterium]
MAIAWQARASAFDAVALPQTIPETAPENSQPESVPTQSALASNHDLPPADAPPRDGPVPAVAAAPQSLAGAPALPSAALPKKSDAQLSLSAPPLA